MEEKIVKVLNVMSEYLSIAQLKKLQEVILQTFAENEADFTGGGCIWRESGNVSVGFRVGKRQFGYDYYIQTYDPDVIKAECRVESDYSKSVMYLCSSQ